MHLFCAVIDTTRNKRLPVLRLSQFCRESSEVLGTHYAAPACCGLVCVVTNMRGTLWTPVDKTSWLRPSLQLWLKSDAREYDVEAAGVVAGRQNGHFAVETRVAKELA